MQARVRFVRSARNPLRRSCVWSARNAGESAICRLCAQPSAEIVRVECAKCRRECDLPPAAQPSAEIVRVECAKCRRECDLPAVRATLCGDRACRVREMQARVRFVRSARNPLRRSCVSSARNAGESAICPMRAQPSAEIVRVEGAKCRRERDLPAVRATLCGDRACRVREMLARVRFAGCARNPLRRSCVSIATQRLWLTIATRVWEAASHTDTHTLPQLPRTHTYADSFPHGHRHTHRNPHTTSTHSTSHFSLHTYRITRTLTSYVMKNAFGPLVLTLQTKRPSKLSF